MKKKKSKNSKGFTIFVVYFIAAFVVMAVLKIPHADKVDASADELHSVSEGVKVVDMYEHQDDASILKKIQKAKRIKAKENASKLQNSEYDLSLAFTGSVVMGDSQAQAFTAYNILPEINVAATIGKSISNAQSDYDLTVSRKPLNVFITYGMNDSIQYKGDTDAFMKVYDELVTNLKKDIPGVNIIICSVLISQQKAIDQKPGLGAAPAYNEALEAYADENGYTFVDASSIQTEDLYAADGIHMQKAFYKKWAYLMASTAGL